MEKINVCLVLAPYLPVPAIKGGAVQNLTEAIIRLNEKYLNLKIDCVTIYDKEASKHYNKYTNTRFLTFRVCQNHYIDCFWRAVSFVTRKIFGVNIRKKFRDRKYNKLILSSKYDLVVFEGNNPHINKKLVECVGKKKMIFHLHRTTQPTNELENNFQYFIGISNYVSNVFAKNDIISKDRIYTLYNGVDLNKFDKRITIDEIKDLKDKYSIKENETVIIYSRQITT